VDNINYCDLLKSIQLQLKYWNKTRRRDWLFL